MSSARKYLPSYTVEDYLRWEGQWELIDGVPVAMSPAPFFRHQEVAIKVSSLLFSQLEKSACTKCRALYQMDWNVDQTTVVRPDILIACGESFERHLEYPPTLIVEILSASTAEKDRTFKYDLYQMQKVRYYLLADPDKNTLEVFELVDCGQYREVEARRDYRFDLDDDCSVTVSVTQMFGNPL